MKPITASLLLVSRVYCASADDIRLFGLLVDLYLLR
jgi:hypothetical protein